LEKVHRKHRFNSRVIGYKKSIEEKFGTLKYNADDFKIFLFYRENHKAKYAWPALHVYDYQKFRTNKDYLKAVYRSIGGDINLEDTSTKMAAESILQTLPSYLCIVHQTYGVI
jgi:hypothetical protein